MNYWITTDTHFGHKKMIEYCKRPENFEELIMNNLRKSVQKDDFLIHLGDICFRNDDYWHSELQKIECKKWLVVGNHDSKSYCWYLNHGWDFVAENFTINIFGGDIVFSHQPLPDSGFFLNIHGHFHNTDFRKFDVEMAARLTPRHILLALEYNNYMPFNLKWVVENHFNKKIEL